MDDEVQTYYGNPVLKAPTWKPYIPTYFYLGGLAAGSSLLGVGADAVGDAALARAARVTALGAVTVGAGALVADLGRSSRFHHMLRVFRPSSPMNVGSWLLGAYGPAVGVSAIAALTGRGRVVGRLAGVGAGVLAPAVATYTGVLLADTAVPAWHDARRALPALFASGAAASAGGVASTLVPHSVSARRYAIGGACAETLISMLLHRSMDREVARAYNEGTPQKLRNVAAGASLTGVAALAVGPRSRTLVRLGGAAIAAGALLERFAVMHAGRTSAGNPIATVQPQRARVVIPRSL